jgi:hypothetical protein
MKIKEELEGKKEKEKLETNLSCSYFISMSGS